VKGKTGLLVALGGRLKSGSGRVICSCSDHFGSALHLRLGGRGRRAEDWNRKGLDLMTNGSLEESVQAFNNAIEADPQNAEAWRYKALILRALGRNAEAEEASAKAMDLGYSSSMAIAVAGSGSFVNERVEIVQEATHDQ